MNISLPETLKDYVEARLREGGYGTASEYVRELIRNDQKSAAQEQLERLLLEGLESGEPVQIDEDFWAKKKADLTKRIQSKS
ncbi:MAG: antitoxin ParD1/3/4 [Verrucomicrobiales bacterium]|jgi:antitoxin ParD1/3/4